MPKDAINNEVKAGHLVQVTLDSNILRARVKEVQDGGLSIPMPGGKSGVQPGMIVVNADILIPFNPQNPQVQNIVRLVDPEEEKNKLVH